MSHTKGPWMIQGQIDKETGMVHISGHNWGSFAGVVVEMDDGIPSKEGRANARLIAAAPELLEACKSLYNAKGNQSRLEKALIKAEAAITKAEAKL